MVKQETRQSQHFNSSCCLDSARKTSKTDPPPWEQNTDKKGWKELAGSPVGGKLDTSRETEMKTKVSSFITTNIHSVKIQMEENTWGKINKKSKERGKFLQLCLLLQWKENPLAVGADGLVLAMLLIGCVTLAKTVSISGPQFPVWVQPQSKQTHPISSSIHWHLPIVNCSYVFMSITYKEAKGKEGNC